jgi:DNA-binding NtrC family response regulator
LPVSTRSLSLPYQPKLNERLCELVDCLIEAGLPLDQARREFERVYLVRALRQHGSLIRAAEALAIHRNTLRNRLQVLSVTPDEYRSPGRPRSRS